MGATALGTIYGEVRLRTDTLTSDASTIKGIFADLRDAVMSLFSVENPATPLEDSLAGLPATAEGAMSGLADSVKSGVEQAASAAAEGASNLAEAIQTGITDATDEAETGVSRLGEIFQGLRDQVSTIGSGISEGISGAFASIKSSGDTLVGSLGGTREGLGKLGEGFKETLGHATEFATGMLEFQALAGATQAVGDFASSIIGMNTTFESLHQQLTSITGSSGAADKILAWVKDFGQQVPDTTEHLAEAVVTVQSLGVNATQVMPSIANVAAAMGTDLPTAAHAFADAFEGRFMMLQTELHISKDQLADFGLKMDKTGKVDSKSLISAFEKLSQSKFGNAIHNQMQTLQGQLSNLTDRVEFFAQRIGGPIFDTAKQALSGLFSFLDAHQKTIDQLADTVGKGLADAFHTIGTVATDVLDFFQSHREAVDALKGAFIGLAGAVGAFLITLLPSLPALLTGVAGLAAGIGGIAVAAAPFVAIGLAVAGLALAIKHAYDTSVPFRTAVQDIGERLKQFGAHLAEVGQTLLTKLSPFIREAVSHVQQFVGELSTRVGPALTNVMHFLEALGSFVSTVFIAIWPTLQGVLAGAWQAIQGVIEIAWSVISGIFKVALDIIGGNWKQAWADLKDMLAGVLAGVVKLLGGLLPAVGSLLSGLGQLLLAILGHAWDAIKAGIGALLGGIGSFLGDQIGRWRQVFQIGLAFVEGIVQGVFNRVKQAIQNAIDTVVGIFNWLFAHNTYFHDFVVGIEAEFNAARDFLVGIWKAITGWLSDEWKTIQKDAAAAWALVQAFIINPVKEAITTIQQKLGEVRDFIVGKWNDIKADAKAAWDSFVGQITGAGSRVQGAVSGVISNITTPLGKLKDQALQWGKNLIQGFIDGINSMIQKVKDAAGNVAGGVASMLGFHSPAKEGPGRDADTWAPSLMDMFTHGIEAGTPAVSAAATRAAQALHNGITSSGSLSLASLAGARASAGNASGLAGTTYNITLPPITVVVDDAEGATPQQLGTQFGSALGQAFTAEMNQRGHTRS